MRTLIRAVCLVEARLEDDAAGNCLSEPREMFGYAKIERVVLEDTRAGDEKERITSEERSHVQSAASTSDESRGAEARRLALTAAATKPAKSGCGRVGRDWSSGWNWQPMNHG